MFLGNKGQSSFEVVLVSAAIIAGVVFFVSVFQSSYDSTTAMAILKSRLVEKFNSMEASYVVERIDFSEDAAAKSIVFNVKTRPRITDLNIESIVLEIKQKTKFKNNVEINFVSVGQ